VGQTASLFPMGDGMKRLLLPRWLTMLSAVLLIAAAGWPATLKAKVVADAAACRAWLAQTRAAGRCYYANLLKGTDGTVLHTTSDIALAPTSVRFGSGTAGQRS